jgi:hypothetical protein
VNRSDKLLVSIYANHGDTCSLAPHCKSLGCISRVGPDDYVLSAKFAYLQEAIDYAMAVSARGVRTKLVSRIAPGKPYVSNYPKKVEVRP